MNEWVKCKQSRLIYIYFVCFYSIANTGGLLGLFMGFSIFSIIEIVYYVTVRPYCASRTIQMSRRRRHKNVKLYLFYDFMLCGQISIWLMWLFFISVVTRSSEQSQTCEIWGLLQILVEWNATEEGHKLQKLSK